MSFNCDDNKDNCDKCKYTKNDDKCSYTIYDTTTNPHTLYEGKIPCSRNIDNITVPYKNTMPNIKIPCPGSINNTDYNTSCIMTNKNDSPIGTGEINVNIIILLSTSVFFFLLFIIFMVKNYRKG